MSKTDSGMVAEAMYLCPYADKTCVMQHTEETLKVKENGHLLDELLRDFWIMKAPRFSVD